MSDRVGSTVPDTSLRAGLRRWFLQPPRRHGEVIEDRTVSFLELLYDLVFVVLIGQIAVGFEHDLTWGGLGTFAALFGLIWIAWLNGTVFHELHGREDGRSRISIFAQMGILALLAVYAGAAGGADGRDFAGTYFVLLVVLTAMWASVRRQDAPEFRRATTRYVAGMAASAAYMAATTLLPSDARVAAWGLFVCAWIAGGVLLVATTGDGSLGVTATDALVERFNLFTIIVLGEIVFGVVEGISRAGRDAATLATGVLVLCVGFGFWWNYFDLAGRRLPRAGDGWLTAWVYCHLALTLAIAASGVAMAALVQHAGEGRAPAGAAWLLGASVAVVLLALVAVLRSLRDPHADYRGLPVVLAAAAAASALLGWARPAPWLLALALVLVLLATWLSAFASRFRSEAALESP